MDNPFTPDHHGPEVIITTGNSGHVYIDYKKPISADEFIHHKFEFETQTQCERLLPSIMKAIK